MADEPTAIAETPSAPPIPAVGARGASVRSGHGADSTHTKGWVALAVAATLVAPLVVVFRRAFAGQAVEAMDFLKWTLPSRTMWANAILEGRIPQWNPLSDLGSSVLYAPVHGVFYPPNLLLLLGPPLHALTLLFALHLLVTGVGGYLLGRQLQCRPSVALCQALAWELGYQFWMWGMGEKVLSGAWVPWATLGLMRAIGEPRWCSRATIGTAAAYALIALAGDPFLWFHAALLGTVLGWASLPADLGPTRSLARVASRTAIPLALGALLAAPQLVPTLSLLPFTERAGGLPQAVAEVWSLRPIRLLDLVAPGTLGTDMARTWCAHFYFGMALILCAPLAGNQRLVKSLWAVVVLALVLAIGRHGPFDQWARALFPPLALLRFPEKHTLVLVAGLGCLAAVGMERLIDRKVRLHWLVLVVAGSAGLALLAARSEYAAQHGGHGVAHALLALAAFTALLCVVHWRPALAWLLPLGAAIELTVFVAPKLTWIPARAILTPPASIAAMARPTNLPPARVLIDDGAQNPIPPNTGYLFNLGHVYAHETALGQPMRKLLKAFDARRSEAATLLDIGWWLRRAGREPGLARIADVDVVRLRGGRRLRLVGHVQVAEDDRAVRQVASATFDPDRLALLAPTSAARSLDTAVTGQCWHIRFSAEHLDIRCQATDHALLVMADAYAPGWNARLDGQPAALLRVDVALRGVFVPPGEHDVSLTYWTPGLTLGLWLGGLGLLLALAVVLWAGRGKPLH